MELANRDESTASKWKVVTLEIKYKSRINGVIEKGADCGNVDIATIQETLDSSRRNLVKAHLLTDVNEESGCDKKGENVLRDMKLAKNYLIKVFSEVFHDMERAKDKILEADLELIKENDDLSSKIAVYCKGERKASTVQTILDKLFTKK